MVTEKKALSSCACAPLLRNLARSRDLGFASNGGIVSDERSLSLFARDFCRGRKCNEASSDSVQETLTSISGSWSCAEPIRTARRKTSKWSTIAAHLGKGALVALFQQPTRRDFY